MADRPDATHLPNGLPRLLGSQELADYLGVPLATVYSWAYLGQGPTPIRVGKYTRYSVEDIERWLTSRTASGPERRRLRSVR